MKAERAYWIRRAYCTGIPTHTIKGVFELSADELERTLRQGGVDDLLAAPIVSGKLDRRSVLAIRDAYVRGDTFAQIAADYGVSHMTVINIVQAKKNFESIGKPLDRFDRHPKAKLTKREKLLVRYAYHRLRASLDSLCTLLDVPELALVNVIRRLPNGELA